MYALDIKTADARKDGQPVNVVALAVMVPAGGTQLDRLRAVYLAWREFGVQAKAKRIDIAQPYNSMLRVLMPCGSAWECDDPDDLPSVDKPCPCGCGHHWFVKYFEIAPEGA